MSTAQTKPKNKEDPRAVKAARLFVLMEQYPEDKLSVIDAMKARRYKEDEATNRVLQMQVRRAIERLKNEGFGPPTKPPPEVPSAGPVAAAASASAKVSPIPPSKNADTRVVSFEAHPDAPAQLGSIPKFDPEEKTRKTAKQAQKERNNKKRKEKINTAAHKRCTLWYSIESEKENGLSASEICKRENEVEFKGKTSIQPRTVTRYVRDGLAGQSPKKRGYTGLLDDHVFKLVCDAFETYVQIQQINSKDW